MRNFEATFLVPMIVIYSHLKNCVGTPVVTTETMDGINMEVSRFFGNELPNNSKNERDVTLYSISDVPPSQSASAVHDDNLPKHSTLSDLASRKNIEVTTEERMNDNINMGDQPDQATSVAQEHLNIPKIHLTTQQISRQTSSAMSSPENSGSSGDVTVSDNYHDAEATTSKDLIRQYEQRDLDQDTEEKSHDESPVSTKLPITNKAKDVNSGAGLREVTTQAASATHEENTPVDNEETFSYPSANNYLSKEEKAVLIKRKHQSSKSAERELQMKADTFNSFFLVIGKWT